MPLCQWPPTPTLLCRSSLAIKNKSTNKQLTFTIQNVNPREKQSVVIACLFRKRILRAITIPYKSIKTKSICVTFQGRWAVCWVWRGQCRSWSTEWIRAGWLVEGRASDVLRLVQDSRTVVEIFLPQIASCQLQSKIYTSNTQKTIFKFLKRHKDPTYSRARFGLLYCQVLNIWSFSELSEVSDHHFWCPAHSWAQRAP